MVSSKVTKSLFAGGSIIFAGMIIQKLLGLTYRVIVGRFIGPEAYGIISVMIAVFSIVATVAYIGIPQGVQKYVSSYRGKNDLEGQIGVIRTGLILTAISSTLTGIALFLLAPWLAAEIFNDLRVLWPIRFVALILPLRMLRKIGNSITDGYEEMQYTAYSLKIYPHITMVGLTIILAYMGYDYLGAAAAFTFAYGTAFILAVYYAYQKIPEAFNYNYSGRYEPRKLFHHSWPLFAAGLLGTLAGYIDTLMLQTFMGAREVGLYQGAYPFAAILTFGGTIFGSIYLSNASKLYGENKIGEMNESYRLVVKWTAMLSVPAFLIMFAFPQLFLQIFGSEYLGMGNVLRILAIGFLFSAIIGPVSKTLQAIEKTQYKLYITLFTATTNITLNYLLIPIYGIVGAAIATAGTFILAFAIKLAVIKKLTGTQPYRYSVLKVILVSTLAILTAYIPLKTLFGAMQLWHLIPASIIFGTTYTVLILYTQILEEEDLQTLKYIKEKTGLKSEKIEKIIKKHSQ